MPSEGEVVRSGANTGSSETSQTLTLLAQKILGGDNTPPLSQEQMDKFIEQRGTIIGYIHQDKIRDSWDAKFYLLVILAFILLIACLVTWRLPEYFGEVLSLIVGLFGGGAGGFGLAKWKSL